MNPPAFIAQFGIDQIVWLLLGLIGAIGVLAVISPKRFESLAKGGSHWVDTNKLFLKLDKRVDVDRHVLPFSRWLGAAVIASVILIGFIWARR